MEDDKKDELKEEKNIKKEPMDENVDNVTREINLDELYDGAVNNTVVIDPITNDEILLPSKKPNFTLVGVFLAIIVLLVLYYVNNKSELSGTNKEVEPLATTTTTQNSEIKKEETGVLNCTYNSKSDAETQNVNYVLNYKNGVVIDSKFSYVVVSNQEVTSAVIEDLKSQYESFYINNAAVVGNNVTYEKDNKGFTFGVETNYATASFEKIMITEGQTILYVKPDVNDTYNSLQNAYVEKGFTCSISTQ